MKRKIVVLGAGHVGSHIAYSLAMSNLADEIALVDIIEEKAKSQALDIADAVGFFSHAANVRAGSYSDCADADLIYVAIGTARLPGQTRLDVLDTSAVMIREAAAKLKAVAPRGIIVTITNPADVINYILLSETGFDPRRCFSSGTALDTARLRQIIFEKTGVPHDKINAYVIGEHGDSSVVAFSSVRVNSKSFEETGLCFDDISEKTRMRGMHIIDGKGSTEFGIGTVCADIAAAVLQDRKKEMQLSTLLCGEYGQYDVCAGVPCVLGKNGIEEIKELSLTEKESELFSASCTVIRKYIDKVTCAKYKPNI